LARKDIASVFDALGSLIATELGKKGPGQFIVPGLLKLKVVRKPATKAKQGINPFTKEPMTIKAKPARNVVRAVPMKALKELV
ncbi:HU family DNA-binding protein, partial [Singulisphaera rosea]